MTADLCAACAAGQHVKVHSIYTGRMGGTLSGTDAGCPCITPSGAECQCPVVLPRVPARGRHCATCRCP